MAQKEKTDYKALIKALHASGPCGIRLLWGQEEYLLEQFFAEIKKLCFAGGDGDFDHRRFEGPVFDFFEIAEAVDTPPVFAEKTLVEVRGLDLNRLAEADSKALRAVAADFPDYCCMVLIPPPGFEPDGRLSLIKDLKKMGGIVEFTAQGQHQLVNWIARRARAGGKTFAPGAAEHLIFTCGGYMNRLTTEIIKLCAFASGDEITKRDIDAVVIRLPEAVIFNITDLLSARDFDGAAGILADLLEQREPPVMLLAVIGQQFRRLYAARLTQQLGLDEEYLREITGLKYDFLIKKLQKSARGFSLSELRRAVRLCAAADYAMKSTSAGGENLLKELLVRIYAGGGND